MAAPIPFFFGGTSSGKAVNERSAMRASINTYRQIAAVLGLTLDDLFYDDAMALRIHKSFSRDGLLAGCTDYEKIILGEAFLALKLILERNRE